MVRPRGKGGKTYGECPFLVGIYRGWGQFKFRERGLAARSSRFLQTARHL